MAEIQGTHARARGQKTQLYGHMQIFADLKILKQTASIVRNTHHTSPPRAALLMWPHILVYV